MSSSAPTRKQRSPWWVVIGAGLATAFGPGPITLSTLGLFVIPITEATGWGRTTVTGAFSLAALGMAIGLPIVGRLLDRFAIRPILVISVIGFASFTALIGATPEIIPLFLLPYFFVGLFGAGTGIPITKALMSWFDNKRGLAIGLTAGITGVGTSLVPILAGLFIANFGWRGAYPMLGLVAVVIPLAMVFAFIRVRAERSVRGRLVTETVENNREVSLEVPGLTLKEAVKGRHFWFIVLGLGVAGVVVVGLQVHLVPMMTDRGLDPAQGVVLLTIFGLTSLLGRVVGGFLLDRIHGTIIGPIVILAPVIGLFFLQTPFATAAIAVGFIGLAFGIEADLLSFFITRYLGMRAFGRIMGIVVAAFLLGNAVGPLLLGLGYDTFGSYDPVVPALGVALVLAATSVAFLGKYRYPAIKGFDKIAAKDELAAAKVLSEVAEAEDARRKDDILVKS